MAKINARGTHQVGPTLFTEKTITWEGEGRRVYYEAWRMRSDGFIQTRIIRTRPAEGEQGRVTEHRGSSFRNVMRTKQGIEVTIDILRGYLARRGYIVVKEQWR